MDTQRFTAEGRSLRNPMRGVHHFQLGQNSSFGKSGDEVESGPREPVRVFVREAKQRFILLPEVPEATW